MISGERKRSGKSYAWPNAVSLAVRRLQRFLLIADRFAPFEADLLTYGQGTFNYTPQNWHEQAFSKVSKVRKMDPEHSEVHKGQTSVRPFSFEIEQVNSRRPDM